MQGLSGILGFPFTALADVGVIFTHYGPMLNDIRRVYSRNELSKNVLAPIVKGCSNEIIADLVLDKFIGQIPLMGIAANMICAKALTWRLGILFGMLAARGEDINEASVTQCVRLIRNLFPQADSLLFKKPSVTIVESLLSNIEGNSQESFDCKVMALIKGLENS